jgi:hypothetical protein
MKTSIKTLFESSIRDNKSFIKAYSETGNIKEYYAGNIEQNEDDILFYLSDEEIEFCENHPEDECAHIYDKVWDFIYSYDMTVEDFLGEKVEPAY